MTTQLVLVAGSRVLRRVGVRLQSQCTIRRAARRAARRTRSVMKKRRRKTYMLEHQTWIRAISLRAERRRTGSAPGLRLLSRPRIRSSRGGAVVRVCWWVWMVVRFFCVIRVPVCARVSRLPPVSFYQHQTCRVRAYGRLLSAPPHKVFCRATVHPRGLEMHLERSWTRARTRRRI